MTSADGRDGDRGTSGSLFREPYREWARNEGIPITGGFGVDLLGVDVRPWPRIGADAAFVHLEGRGDFVDIQVIEIPPAGQTEPQRHLYEVVLYVLDGIGSTEIDLPGAPARSIEWKAGSLVAIPLNARYTHHNGSGKRRARLAAVTTLPLMLNVLRNESVIFENDHAFPERVGPERHFQGDGTFVENSPGRHLWETSFVPDLRTLPLQAWAARGAGSSNIMFVLADGTMHAHMSEMPVGTYKKGHRHGPDFHVFGVTGEAYSLYWYEGDRDIQRFDWKHGCVFAPADRQFHQHFNVSGQPVRYLAIAFGSLRYPTVADKLATWMGMDVSVRAGGRQIEYEDEDPRIRRIFEEELAARGVPSRMDAVFGAAAGTAR